MDVSSISSLGSTSSTSSTGAAAGAGAAPGCAAGRRGGRAGTRCRRGHGVVDVEDQGHLRPEVVGQGRLHDGLLLGALLPVRRVGQREVGALVVHRHEATAGVARLGPRRQRLQDAVTPGLGEAVAIERAGAGPAGAALARQRRRGCTLAQAPVPRRAVVPARAPSRRPVRAQSSSLLRRMAPMEGRRATSAGGRAGGGGLRRGSGRCRPGRTPAGAPRVRPVAPGRGKAGAPDWERSRTLTRSDSASIPESRSGRTARTAAISRTTCASGASRMSTSA